MPARNSEVVERLKEYADSAEAINTGDVVGRLEASDEAIFKGSWLTARPLHHARC